MSQKVDAFLKSRENDGLLRDLTEVKLEKNSFISVKGKRFVNFSSNDYLGISSHKDIIKAFHAHAGILGTASSRLITGTTAWHSALEARIADFKGKESALVFNSGYQANVGIISALFDKGDVIFADRLVHASIIDGILLSGAKLFRFKHNDISHLKDLLSKERGKFKKSLIVTEAVFSMDADVAPVNDIASLNEKYNSYFMIDEAHSTGIFGKNGSGIIERDSDPDKCDLIMGTFSKALGSFGAYVALSRKLRSYLINAARSFIYSTSLPEPIIMANIVSLEIVKKEPYRRLKLLENASYLREKLSGMGFTVKGASQIVPIIIGDNRKTYEFSEKIKEKGYWVIPVRPPTVPKGTARLRLSLTYNHSRNIVDRFLNDLYDIQNIYRA